MLPLKRKAQTPGKKTQRLNLKKKRPRSARETAPPLVSFREFRSVLLTRRREKATSLVFKEPKLLGGLQVHPIEMKETQAIPSYEAGGSHRM